MDVVTLGAALSIMKKMPDTAASSAAAAEDAADRAEAAAEQAEGAIEVDDTLSVKGRAADAKVTGEKIGDLKDALNVINVESGIIEPALVWTSGKYINNTTNQITAGSEQLYISDYIKIPYLTYKIKADGMVRFANGWTIAFYDNDKTFISGKMKVAGFGGVFIIESIPDNAAYFILGHQDYNGDYPVGNVNVDLYTFDRLFNIENNVEFLDTKIDKINEGSESVTLQWTNAKRLNVSGEIVNASNAFNLSQGIDIHNDPFYKIEFSGLYGISDGSTIAFYDEQNAIISGARYAVNDSYTINKNDIPANTYYVYVCHYTTGEHITSDVSVVKKYSKRLDDIENDVAELDDKIDAIESDIENDIAGLDDKIDVIESQNVLDESYKNVLSGALTFTDNKFVNNNGVVTGNPNFCLIDGYYEVKPNTVYKLYRDEPPLYSNAGHNWTWWDENKNFISYVLSGAAVISPENAAFLRFAVYISNTGSVTHETFDPTKVIITEDAKPVFNDDFTDRFVSRPTLKGLKWIGVGDSITEENFRAVYHYHDYIKTETGLTFVNMGVSGTGYKAEGSGDKAFYKRVPSMATDADVITIFGGVNDVVLSNATIGTETDTGTTTICGCVNETLDIIESLYPAHMPIGIISPLPCACVDTTANLHPLQNPNDDTCRMAQFVEQLGLICKHRGIPFLDLFHQSNLRPWNEACRQKYFSCESAPNGDGLHPNGYGHRLIYRQIMDFVQRIAMR